MKSLNDYKSTRCGKKSNTPYQIPFIYHLEMTCYQLLRLFQESLKIKGSRDLGSTAGLCGHFVTSAAMHCQTSTRGEHLTSLVSPQHKKFKEILLFMPFPMKSTKN